MTAPVLEVADLRKEFVRGLFRKRTVAVDGVSFRVERGEVFGFLGPNGAGKTTTMKMLMGLIYPSSGKATILGAEVGDIEAKRRIGYLPENPYFYDYLSATEYMHMVGRIYGLDRAERSKRSTRLLGRLGLAMAESRAMRSYSKGMLQRVGLAQALISDPELVVLDEPMSGLDPIGRREVRELILELRGQGKTVFFSTHILADANLLCDRVGIIVKGKLRDVGPLGELLSPKVLRIEVLWQGDAALQAALREQFGQSEPSEQTIDEEVHQTSSEGHVFIAQEQAQLDRFVAAVIAGGGQVSSVTPQRETLEQLFVRDSGATPEEQRS
jgi:ABC-2 type transport system ATP-binding protein